MSRFTLILSIALFVSFALLGSFIVQGQRLEIPTQPNQELRPIVSQLARQAPRGQRLREGTKFKDKLFFFRQTGDRAALYTAEDQQRFTCLENLELERILKVIQEQPGRDYWKIEGEFTEFRGENFILIRRAVIAQPPTH